MTFTYAGALATTSEKVRLEIGDTVQDEGVLPGGRNFTDEEIDYFDGETGSDFWETVGRCFDAAAAAWAPHPTSYRLGPEGESISAYEFFTQRAAQARSQGGKPSSLTVTKADYGIDTS